MPTVSPPNSPWGVCSTTKVSGIGVPQDLSHSLRVPPRDMLPGTLRGLRGTCSGSWWNDWMGPHTHRGGRGVDVLSPWSEMTMPCPSCLPGGCWHLGPQHPGWLVKAHVSVCKEEGGTLLSMGHPRDLTSQWRMKRAAWHSSIQGQRLWKGLRQTRSLMKQPIAGHLQ